MKKIEYYRMFEVEDKHFWYKGMREITFTLIKDILPKISKSSKSSYKILDAGCGTGANIIWLSQYATVTGFDFSETAISLCQKRGITSAIQGSIEHIPYPSNTYNIVVCLDVLGQKQIADHNKAIQELHRVLLPGGSVLLRVAAYDWLRSYHDRAVHTKHRYTIEELSSIFSANGFEITRTTYTNFFLFPLSLLMRLKTRVFGKHAEESDVKMINPYLNAFFFLYLRLESVLLNWINLPFGLSAVIVAKKPH